MTAFLSISNKFWILYMYMDLFKNKSHKTLFLSLFSFSDFFPFRSLMVVCDIWVAWTDDSSLCRRNHLIDISSHSLHRTFFAKIKKWEHLTSFINKQCRAKWSVSLWNYSHFRCRSGRMFWLNFSNKKGAPVKNGVDITHYPSFTGHLMGPYLHISTQFNVSKIQQTC